MSIQPTQTRHDDRDPLQNPPPGAHRQFVSLVHELGGILWEMDARTWRFTFVSERAERVFGYPIQRWYDEPTFWQDQLLHPEDRDWCVNFCTVASAQCRDHAFLYRARAADGGERWIKDIVRVVPNGEGFPVLMRGVMVDVTEALGDAARRDTLELDYEAPELERFRAILAA